MSSGFRNFFFFFPKKSLGDDKYSYRTTVGVWVWVCGGGEGEDALDYGGGGGVCVSKGRKCYMFHYSHFEIERPFTVG